MGHVARCYKIFFHKNLSIFSLFIVILYLKYEHLNHHFQQMKNFLYKLHTWYTFENLIIKSFQIVLFYINLSQYYITIESFIHKGHYIKVYWVHLIIFDHTWRCFCTTFKIHNKLNTKDFTMKFNIVFWCLNSFLTHIPFHHLHISIGINYYWEFKNYEEWTPNIQSVTS
jgi:hypothetical protein